MNHSSNQLAPVPLRPEDAWLLVAVRDVLLRSTEQSSPPSADIDWSYLLKQSSLHALVPCLAQYCDKHAEKVPVSVLAQLRQELAHVRAYNFFLLQELARVCALLQSAGIRVLAWKGPALAVAAYPDSGLRLCADLDLLVSPADLAKAVEVLSLNGYREQSVDTGGHTRNLERASPQAVVELHSLVAQAHFSIPLEVPPLLNKAVNVTTLTGSIPTPAPEHLLLLLCIHGSKHVWERVIWICDVVLLLRANPQLDWTTVWTEARTLRVERILSSGLLLADGITPGCVPAAALEKARQDRQAIALSQQVCRWMFLSKYSYAHGLKRAWFLLSIREHFRDRRLLLRRYSDQAITPSEADKAAVKLPAWCEFLYYLIRPIRLLMKVIFSR